MSGSYQDQTKLEKPEKCFGWSLKKSFRTKHGGIFVKSIQECYNLHDKSSFKKETEGERKRAREKR